ncbi:MAG TPA: Holliday junction branch migration protein RuvA [Candidatus Yaniella excrementigallinarum]|nr:Holliday junction branch migration protein RuvA [Candidatus Yaniella excrementigallinarum]
MISSLTGEIQEVAVDSAVIAVGGVGYLFAASPNTVSALRIGQETTVQTLLLIRDDNPVLYGFGTADEREIFEIMMTVSGIGPRIALAVLSIFEPDQVRRHISEQDDKAFTQVPGIGPKSARRIILELSGKLVPREEEGSETKTVTGQPVWQEQVQQALIGLGWKEKDAAKGIAQAIKADPGLAASANVSDALRASLQNLGDGQTRQGI